MNYILPFPIGGLKILDTFEYVDGPKIFSCQNQSGQKFITNWIDTTPTSDTWFYVPVSDDRLLSVKNGEISLRNCILMAENGEFYEVVTPSKGFSEVLITKRTVESVVESELPDEDSFIEIINDFYLEKNKNSTMYTNEESIFTPIETKNNESPMLHLKETTKITALKTKRDVLDLSFDVGGTHKHEIDAFVLGYMLIHTQDLVNYIPFTKKESGRYKLAKEKSGKSKLKTVGFYAASFGVRLESEVETDLFGDTELSSTIETLMKLIDSTNSIPKLKSFMGDMNIKVTKIYYEFLNLLNDEKIELIAEWASPNEKHAISRLNSKSISEAIKAIKEETKKEENILDIIGQLVGINVNRNKFNLLTDNDEHIHGIITESLRNEKFTVPLRVEAKIKEATEVNLLSGKETTVYTLLEIKAL